MNSEAAFFSIVYFEAVPSSSYLDSKIALEASSHRESITLLLYILYSFAVISVHVLIIKMK
jgi:hypothetical protein